MLYGLLWFLDDVQQVLFSECTRYCVMHLLLQALISFFSAVVVSGKGTRETVALSGCFA